ncbi:MlaD family protein [Thiocystis violacea]|uniref:MlaD family protein n=1 Tax=Thiocystis violacea TaxID=13725 RepID=UPI00190497A6|nr:mammalian cell entry protein [Thiocystis violacea]MBK1718878.1 mammalian cell entry protein [Thiocystis violacea]
MSRDEDRSWGRLDRLYSPPEIGGPGKRHGRAQRRDLLFAGLFVLLMALVALAALTLSTPGLFGRAYRLDAYFLDAKGLDAGIQVVQDGYVIGLVERVAPIFPGRDPAAGPCPRPPAGAPPRHPDRPCFRASLRLKSAWPVPRDSLAQLGSAGLLQGEVIKIHPGLASERLGPGERIQSLERELDPLAQLGGLTEMLKSLIKETITPTLVSLRDQIKTIETLIGTSGEQSGNRERLAGTFENLRLLSERLNESVDPKAIAAILGSVKTMSDNLARMTAELSGSTQDIERAVTQYGELAVDIRGLVRENRPALQRTMDDTRLLLQELSAALTPILTNIEDATRDLSALSSELRQNPTTILKPRAVEERTPWFQ